MVADVITFGLHNFEKFLDLRQYSWKHSQIRVKVKILKILHVLQQKYVFQHLILCLLACMLCEHQATEVC
jgi:hypothetical protein